MFETEWTSSAEVYLPGGRAPEPGRLLRNPALAATWRRLLAETAGAGGREARIDAAREVWRTGFIAEALVRQAGRPTLDTSGEHHTGTLTAADLAAWSAGYETPATYDWNGWTVCKPRPWSQGPVLLQQLALLPDELPEYGSADCLHLLIEGCKLAMADREAWYGDAAEVPLADLLSAEYNAGRRRLIGEHASLELRPGSPGGRAPRLGAHARRAATRAARHGVPGAGEPTVAKPPTSPVPGEPVVTGDGHTRGDTCHLDVADRWGNLVAATPSGGWLQSKPRRARTRLPARHPAADDLAGGGPAQLADARPPSAHHPQPVDRPARRRARPRLRHTRRRPAGPVATALLPGPRPAPRRPRRPRPPGRRGCPELAPGRPGRVVLPARDAARQRHRRVPHRPRHRRRTAPPGP
ncbi:gamma-glutamyltranspeptidase [Streptomyces sp. e14]|nr:gamma-glutamyltranspeptidase [Streptomyces sp. e14]